MRFLRPAAPLLFGAACLLAFFFSRTPVVQGTFGGVSLTIELATTPAAREKGLSGRRVLEASSAMLFAFAKDDLYGFWMKDMIAPIDIFWLDSEGRVVSVAASVAPSSYPSVFYPAAPARYVLETAAGFAAAHGVATGTPLLLKNLPHVSQ